MMRRRDFLAGLGGAAAGGLVAGPALAGRCLDINGVVTGVHFKRQDGRKGWVTGKGAQVKIVYAHGAPVYRDTRETFYGIFETRQVQLFHDEMPVGEGETVLTWKFAGKPAAPVAGKGWSGTVRETGVSYGPVEGGKVEWKASYKAVYSYLAEKTVELSGCSYRIVPVEAAFTGKTGSFTRRWVYFLDLGFGIETKRDGKANGLVALTPA